MGEVHSGKNKLAGYFYGESNQKGLLVLSHGLGGGADSYLPQIMHFVDDGWNVFAYDSTGSFGSEGKSTGGFPQSTADLDAALNFLSEAGFDENNDIVLFGHSWGGYGSLCILALDHNIKGVVSVSAMNNPMDVMMEQGKGMAGIFIYTQYPFLWAYQRIRFGDYSSLTAEKAIDSSDTPVLVIHGKNDDFISYKKGSVMSAKDKISNPGAEYIVVDDPRRSGHNNIFWSDDSVDYLEEINSLYRDLYDSYGGDIPYEKDKAFYDSIDRHLLYELYMPLMNEITNFYNRAAGVSP